MTIRCKSYRASIKDGQVQLEIEELPVDRVLSISEVAHRIGKSAKTVRRLSQNKRNPLPLVRGRGRPFIRASALDEWQNPSVVRYL